MNIDIFAPDVKFGDGNFTEILGVYDEWIFVKADEIGEKPFCQAAPAVFLPGKTVRLDDESGQSGVQIDSFLDIGMIQKTVDSE